MGLSLELVEPDVENTSNAAYLRAFVGNSAVRDIQDQVGLTLDCDLLKGVHARLRISPKFDVHYHLQGNVLGLDPVLADSLMAKRIAAIREKLTIEGVLKAQKAYGPPDDITRIVVIHPDQSASWADLSLDPTESDLLCSWGAANEDAEESDAAEEDMPPEESEQLHTDCRDEPYKPAKDRAVKRIGRK